jgi:hypothetical protein
MPKLVLPPTDAKVKNAKPREKTYKLSDGGGLYLDVTPVGSKLWRLGYTQANGKQKRLAPVCTSLIEDIDGRLTSVKQHPIAKKAAVDRVRTLADGVGQCGRQRLWIVRNAYALAMLSFPTNVSLAANTANLQAAKTLPTALRSAMTNLKRTSDAKRRRTRGCRQGPASRWPRLTKAPGNATFRSQPCNAARGIEIGTPEQTAATQQAAPLQFSAKSQARSVRCACDHIKRFFNIFFLIKECFNMRMDH